MNEPRRLAALHALGLPVAYVRRELLDVAALAAAAPRLPGSRAASAAPAAVPVAAPAAAPAARLTATAAPPARPSAAVAASPKPAAVQPAGASLVAPARLQQIAALGWDELPRFCEDCRACKLGGLRHRAVTGVGHPQARVMVVGEAPGAEEDHLGQPFVGAAGRLLDNMLAAIGLARDAEEPGRAVYIANVIKCRPPGNRNPELDEIAQCQPILQRQIELVQPRLLLALGRFAAQTLSGSTEPIGRLRQQRLQHQGVPLVVSYHPAYLLRSPQDKARAWADLCLAQDLLQAEQPS